MKLRIVLSLLLLCVLTGEMRAQFNMLFTSDNDLPNTLINKIAEDSNGMIWVATEDGLCKFNGSRFITYKHNAKANNSLADNFVRTVCTDDRGNVLIGTIMGVQLYRPHTDDFTPVLVDKAKNIKLGNVNCIYQLRNGDFFVGGNNCFCIHIREDHTPEIRKNAQTNHISDIFCSIEAADGTIWNYIQNKGLRHVDRNGHINKVRDNRGHDYDFAVFCNTADGGLYAGGLVSGIYIYNKVYNNFELISGTETLSRIRDIVAIPNTTLLCIACDGTGVQFYDYRTRHFTTYRQFEDPFIDISSQKTHSIYINKGGDMWMGLYQKGLFMAAQASAPFSYVGPRSQKYNLIGDRCVTGIIQSHDSNIWVTTDNGGLYGFTSDLKLLKQFTVAKTNIPSTVQGLFEDSRHRMWFGSFNHGCGVVNTSTGQCTYVDLEGLDGHLFSVYAYVEDKRGQIWAASMGKGILKYDEKKKKMVQYLGRGRICWSGNILYDEKNDQIYAGTYDGILSFCPTDQKKTTRIVLKDVVVYSISRINDDTIAFSTGIGLVLYNTETGRMQKITTEQGLPTNSIYACLPGINGHVWVSSSSGLTRVNVKNMTVESYTMRDGLQGNEFYKCAALVSKDGRLWFGGINGITCFLPSEVQVHRINCKVRVVSLRSEEQVITPEDDGTYVLSKNTNGFTIELATLPLYLTNRVQYSYRLDHGDWEQLPIRENRISFSNLSYGHHTLYAKTVIDGHESQVSETDIYIEYPWYLTWWAMIIWLAAISIAAYFVWREIQRRRHFNLQLQEHQREEELKESKLQFFMNVVHDLRTPLTLISTPLHKLLTSDEDPTRQHLYGIMSRNSDRLLRLTDQIMDLRKIDRGKMDILCKPTEIGRVIRELTKSMDDISERRRQTITLSSKDKDGITVWLDNDSFEKIYINIMSNALKYTPEGGEIHVEWGREATPSTMFPEGALVVSVTDTGIGIPDSEKPLIFNRFFQVRQNGKHIKGTGIGLNLVYSLVKLHHGDIIVSDNPSGQGTRFTVFLPLGKSVFAPEELTVSAISADLPEDVADQHAATRSDSMGILDVADYGEPAEPVSRHISKKRKTVLVVDDDDDIRNFLVEELATIYNVFDSVDAKSALATLMKEHVDLVVSDVMMPGIDGIELCKKIRQNPHLSHVPVILLTAKSSDRDRIEGLASNADAYVTKPFNLDLLMTIMDNLLRRNDSLRNTFSGAELPEDQIETPKVESADEKLMERLVRCINDNLDNPDLTSEFLAQEVGLSRVHLYRKLKELTNQSASNYIRNIRLTKAAELLRMHKATISEISYRVGFRTPNHFATAFKELYGMTPTEYMKEK